MPLLLRIIYEIFRVSGSRDEFCVKYGLSANPVGTSVFDHIFRETDIGTEMLFEGQRTRKSQNFTMTVNVAYKYVEKTEGGI